jgi:hypothetical protein
MPMPDDCAYCGFEEIYSSNDKKGDAKIAIRPNALFDIFTWQNFNYCPYYFNFYIDDKDLSCVTLPVNFFKLTSEPSTNYTTHL